MAEKKVADNSYDVLTASLKSGQIGKFYIFHGEERYLLEHSLGDLRRRLCPGGLDGFNYRRMEGKDVRISDLDDAINTMPVYAERTLVEIHDLDIFKGRKKAEPEADSEAIVAEKKSVRDDDTKKQQYAALFADIPEYACVVIIFNTLPYMPNSKQKPDKDILNCAQVVEFAAQDQAKLTNWINRRFMALGKRISKQDIEYLALITDGHMASLVGEIDKVAAYSDSEIITRADIDAVVTPVLNAFVYKLTDAILARRHPEAMRILDELFLMREPAQKILFSISLKLRQLLAARVCIDNGAGRKELMDMCGIRYDFQASTLMGTARKATLKRCCGMVLQCAEAAYDLNSTVEPEARLIELLAQLALTA